MTALKMPQKKKAPAPVVRFDLRKRSGSSVLTNEGRIRYGQLIRICRANSEYWPDSLRDWFEAKGGFIKIPSLSQPLFLEWLASVTGWELDTSSYKYKLQRMEVWASCKPSDKLVGHPDPVLLAAFAVSQALSLPAKGDKLKPITDVATQIDIMRGLIDPFAIQDN